METLLRTAETRDGRPLAIRRVLAPDADWAGRILPFLGHKGELWRWQLDQLLTRRFEPLAFRCYLADLAEGGAPPRVAGTICTIEARDVGLFGHVFTDPAHRGRSIARTIAR